MTMRACVVCGGAMMARNSRHLTCGSLCSQKRKTLGRRGRRQRMSKVTRDRENAARRAATRSRRRLLQCSICGEEYLARHRLCLTCSALCRAEYKRAANRAWHLKRHQQPAQKACAVCHRQFTPQNRRVMTCSALCRQEHRRLYINNRNTEARSALSIFRKLITQGPEALL